MRAALDALSRRVGAVRIDVLNGVNLDLLGRRDPAVYGAGSLQDLETTIYGWARELALHVRCRQTNHEGEYVGFLHAALDNADGIIVNPGAWTHYSWAIRDALEPFAGVVSSRCTSRTSITARSGGGTSVLEGLGDPPGRGEGVRGLPRGARADARGERTDDRQPDRSALPAGSSCRCS